MVQQINGICFAWNLGLAVVRLPSLVLSTYFSNGQFITLSVLHDGRDAVRRASPSAPVETCRPTRYRALAQHSNAERDTASIFGGLSVFHATVLC